MKDFLKVFLIALSVFLIAIGVGIGVYSKFAPEKDESTQIVTEDEAKTETSEEDVKKEEAEEKKTPLELAIESSERVNAVLMGVETENRSDTIMFISFDPKTSNVDIISIPRDTYYYASGHEAADQRKINAAYGRGREKEIKNTVEDILKLPVHHYASVKYKAVKAIVDAIGGVKVNVPVRMKYDDPTDNPPFHVNLQKGVQTLKGNDAVGFLRYRHGNMDPDKDGVFYGGYPDGDLGRIKAQQAFVKAAIQKALSLKLPSVIRTALPYVTTDAGMAEILYYEDELLGINSEKIHMQTLPGVAKYKSINGQKLSFFESDASQIEELVKKLYGVE